MNNDLLTRMQYESCVLMIGDSYKEISKCVFDYNWNMVVTTNCEINFSAILKNDKRLVIDITSKDKMQTNLLDKRNLHVVRLLGNQELQKELSDLEVEDLLADASIMLNRIAEIISHNGIIMMEDFENTIITHKVFRQSFRKLFQNQKQIHIFSYKSTDQYIDDLIKQGIVVTYKESINEFFDQNILTDEIQYDVDETNLLQIYIDSGKKDPVVTIDKKLLLETENFATLLNAQLINEVKFPQSRYEDYFYLFLKNSIREPQWYGYSYGFNLRREFEDELYKKVRIGLENVGSSTNKPLLVVGQTGTGKSIALAAVAYKIFNEKKYPVIYINNPDINFYANIEYKNKDTKRKDSPEFIALDCLLEHLENKGAKATLIIWDTSCHSSDRKKCYRLYQALLSRGRKLYLVGTAYELSESSVVRKTEDNVEEDLLNLNKKFVECKASIKLTDEINQLKGIVFDICKIEREKVDRIIEVCGKDNIDFLSFFYLAFDMLRKPLSKGVYKEATLNLKDLDDLFDDEAEITKSIFTFALKKAEDELINAGVVESVKDLSDIQEERMTIAKDSFIKCIAICSLFKHKMPYDFALRILGTYNVQIIKALTRSTFFAVTKDKYDNYEISLRTPLEAQMYLVAKSVSPQEQIDCIKLMLEKMKDSSEYGQQAEVIICERLIRIIGPNSKEYSTKYKIGYEAIIDALRELRENRGIWEPILVSQEITYIREYYGNDDEKLSLEERVVWLEKAINIADTMILKANSSGISLGARNVLVVESANSKLLLCQLRGTNDALLYKELRRDLREVIKYDSQNYHAYVTLLKGSLIEYNNERDQVKKLELLEAMCSIADEIVFENSDVAESDYFQQKASEIYGLLDDPEIQERYIDELIQNGSAAGIYVKARKQLANEGVEFRKGITSKNQMDACLKVYQLLNEEKYHAVVTDSEPCQHMLLNVVWLINNREPIYREGECWATHMREEAWTEILSICNNYILKFCAGAMASLKVTLNIKYIKALCLAQLKQYKDCIDELNTMEEDSTLGLPRVFTKHMICDENGNYRKFVGRLGKYDEIKQRGVVYISEFGKKPIYYHMSRFDVANYEEGKVYNDLEIGLSNISPKVYRELELER